MSGGRPGMAGAITFLPIATGGKVLVSCAETREHRATTRVIAKITFFMGILLTKFARVFGPVFSEKPWMVAKRLTRCDLCAPRERQATGRSIESFTLGFAG